MGIRYYPQVRLEIQENEDMAIRKLENLEHYPHISVNKKEEKRGDLTHDNNTYEWQYFSKENKLNKIHKEMLIVRPRINTQHVDGDTFARYIRDLKEFMEKIDSEETEIVVTIKGS